MVNDWISGRQKEYEEKASTLDRYDLTETMLRDLANMMHAHLALIDNDSWKWYGMGEIWVEQKKNP